MRILPAITLAGLASAHFVLHWPPPAGFNDAAESISPCGSFMPMLNSSSSPNITVDRFAIMIQNEHSVGEWGIRGTVNTAAPYDFTPLLPIVNTTGIGDFCLDNMRAPREWAGKPGIIQIVDNSPDGILYQCAPVNFMTGSNSTAGPECKNATGFRAKWTDSESFEGETGGGMMMTMVMAGHTATMEMPLTGSMSMSISRETAGSMSSSSSGVAPTSTGMGSFFRGLALLAAGLAI